MKIRVHDSADSIRGGILTPEAIHKNLQRSLAELLAALYCLSIGVGKTTAIVDYTESKLWQATCCAVFIFLHSHRQISELLLKYGQQLERAGLVVRTYPRRDGTMCGPLDQEMTAYEKQGLTLLAKVDVCVKKCKHFMDCPYPKRTDPDWAKGADIILAPDALLAVRPDIISVWTESINGNKTQRLPPFAVFDDGKFLDKPRFTQFKAEHLAREVEIAGQSGFMEMAANLRAILNHPDRPLFIPNPLRPNEMLAVQRAGYAKFTDTYRSVLRSAYDYPNMRAWYEHGVYCLRTGLYVPHTSAFLGAYLDPIYVKRRANINEPFVIGGGEIVRHPGTKVVNIKSNCGTQTSWKMKAHNRASLVNLVANAIAHWYAQGRTTVVLGRANQVKEKRAHEAIALIEAALRKRGLGHIRIVLMGEDDLPTNPTLGVVPFLTYGATGFNVLEGYETLVAVTGFNVDNCILTEQLFPELPPSKRPTPTFDSRGGRRRIILPPAASDEDRRYANAVLFRLEADPVLQALGRIRQATNPRTAVVMAMYELVPHIGPVVAVPNITAALQALGISGTEVSIPDGQRAAIRGLASSGSTRAEVAAHLGVSIDTIKRRSAKDPSITFRKGRPPAEIGCKVPLDIPKMELCIHLPRTNP